MTFQTRILLLSLLALSSTVLAAEFDLQVNDISGLDEPWPLIAGLPFPEGKLRDASTIRITRDGEEVPAQIDVTATWRDGSVRWALAGFTASPQGDYKVEYGPEVKRSEPKVPLTVKTDATGHVTVNTGAAAYEFVPDRLMPESGRMGDVRFLADAGDGAYLVDNQGRLARVAGKEADVTTEILKEGPMRVVVRRSGWYVTENGERVARAKAWFQFAANVPYMRVTHTLVLTKNTNEWWIRDYGLRFNTPKPADEVVFALSEPAPLEKLSYEEGMKAFKDHKYEDLGLMFSGMRGREWRTFAVKPDGDEVYMLQETYPHHFERTFNAVIGRAPQKTHGTEKSNVAAAETLWTQPWEKWMEVAGDWADGQYADHGMTVVMPWLAQRFPKEIAFDPKGTRVAFWSGRSGRELDFRPATLVNEYWKKWAMAHNPRKRKPGFSVDRAEELANLKVNAEGAARTHDIWLLPRAGKEDAKTIAARASAAARPPLALADPRWLTATEAIGWPLHPKDTDRFPRVEEVIGDYWNGLLAHSNNLRPTGFIDWGRNPYIRNPNQHFRIGKMEDYYLRRNSWQLYARSGERRYHEYATRFDRFAGDWSIAHWTGGDGKVKGAFVKYYAGPPIHWGYGTRLWARYIAGQTLKNWLMEYYLTGDEYSLDLAKMVGDVYKQQWDDKSVKNHLKELSPYDTLGRLVDLYTMNWDEAFLHMAEVWARDLIDLDNPTGRSEISQNGVLYKAHRKMYNLYLYYRWTGDKLAKQSLLKGLDFRYRFNRIPPAFTKNWSETLYSEAYKWTKRPAYLSVVKHMIDEVRQGPTKRPTIHHSWHVLGSTPTGLALLAEMNEDDIAPYPALDGDEPKPIEFSKPANEPVKMSVFVQMAKTVPEDAPTNVKVTSRNANGEDEPLNDVDVNVERMFATKYDGRRDLRRRHVTLTVPSDAPGGRYTLSIPNASKIVVLESDAPDLGWRDEK